VKLTLLRGDAFDEEKLPFVIWWICNIDLEALFSVG